MQNIVDFISVSFLALLLVPNRSTNDVFPIAFTIVRRSPAVPLHVCYGELVCELALLEVPHQARHGLVAHVDVRGQAVQGRRPPHVCKLNVTSIRHTLPHTHTPSHPHTHPHTLTLTHTEGWVGEEERMGRESDIGREREGERGRARERRGR
jgi:hypothetical protein